MNNIIELNQKEINAISGGADINLENIAGEVGRITGIVGIFVGGARLIRDGNLGQWPNIGIIGAALFLLPPYAKKVGKLLYRITKNLGKNVITEIMAG